MIDISHANCWKQIQVKMSIARNMPSTKREGIFSRAWQCNVKMEGSLCM